MNPAGRRRRGHPRKEDQGAGQSDGSTAGLDVEGLADMVIARALAKIAAALAGEPAKYSTRAGEEPPEFRGRHRTWREVARQIPGSRKVGRWLFVDVADYRRWLAAREPVAPVAAAPANDAPWALDAADFGLRSMRSAR